MGSFVSIHASLCVLLHMCEVCAVWVRVSVCTFVYLPLVVSSARAEHSGLSVPTPSHSTSETHILSDRESERRRKRRTRDEGRKDQ